MIKPPSGYVLKLTGSTVEGDMVLILPPGKMGYWIEVCAIKGDDAWNARFVNVPVDQFEAVGAKIKS